MGNREHAAEVVGGAVTLYSQRLCYLEAGRARGGPLVVLLHGLAGDATVWVQVLALLGRHVHVVAPDLLGAGGSAQPWGGDYSVGAHAARLRDLLDTLGQPRAAVVGHSFGGGVAMSFAYQFPERTAGLGLIASGGLGPDLTLALRLASLPGAAFALGVLATLGPGWVGQLARLPLVRAGIPTSDVDGVGRALLALRDPHARAAFLDTVRGAVNWSGQRLSATDRFDLLSGLPCLLIAGRRDPCIPHQHTVAAHQHLPRSRLEILDSGHFPQIEHPGRVADLISDLVARDLATVSARPARGRTPSGDDSSRRAVA